MNIDFHTIGKISIAFIDDKNKIQNIDNSLNYYFAGKLNDILFISKEYSIDNDIITFDVDTYTEPFLSEITKRNTEIQIELGTNTNGVQTVLLRDFAFAQPRVYIEGLNPGKVDFGDYYTKGEVDSLLSNIKPDLSDYYNKEEIDGTVQQLNELIDENYYLAQDQFNDIDSRLDNLPDDYYNKTEVDSIISKKTKSEFLYKYKSIESVFDETTFTYTYSAELSRQSRNTQGSSNYTKPCQFLNKTFTFANTDHSYKISDADELVFVDSYISSEPDTGKKYRIELYVDNVLIRHYEEETTRMTNTPVNFMPLSIIDKPGEITGNEIKVVIKYEFKDNSKKHVFLSGFGYALGNIPKHFKDLEWIDTNTPPGLAKNIDLAMYFTNPILTVYTKNTFDEVRGEIEKIAAGSTIEEIVVDEYWETDENGEDYYYNEAYVFNEPNTVYIMSPNETTEYFTVEKYTNNTTFIFNTDPNTFAISLGNTAGYYVNKPFDFQPGKTYMIVMEDNSIFWSEVFSA